VRQQKVVFAVSHFFSGFDVSFGMIHDAVSVAEVTHMSRPTGCEVDCNFEYVRICHDDFMSNFIQLLTLNNLECQSK
jgi:hypothetical protein